MLGYTPCYQLFVLQLYKLSFICSFIHDYFVIIYLQFIMLWSMYTLFICTNIFPFSYTLVGSLSDEPGFACPDWICFISLTRCLLRTYTLRGVWSFSLLDSGIHIPHAFIYSCDYSLVSYISYSSYSIPYSVSCMNIYMPLQWSWFIIV